MARAWLLCLVCIACTRTVETRPFRECGDVLATHYEPSHAYLRTWVDSAGHPHTAIEHTSPEWLVTFACEHGQFTVEGSWDEHERLWQKMKPGMRVEIVSRAVHEQYDDGGIGRFIDFNFKDANPKPGCVTEVEQ